MEIHEIRVLLQDNLREVCSHLIPNGREIRGEYEVGSVAGEEGKSLKLCTRRSSKEFARWKDFATGEGGDLIDLWCANRGLSLRDALVEIREHFGIEAPDLKTAGTTAYAEPTKPACGTPKAAAKDYLNGRGISDDTIAKFKVGETAAGEIVFPFLQDEKLVACKIREAVDGAKPKPTEANLKPILFGWQAVPDDAREIVITEGEIDALSFAEQSIPALSVPFGGGSGGKQNWINHEYHNLDRFEKIYLALDMDDPGNEASAEITKRLGIHRCYRVLLPHKDANECIQKGVSLSDYLDSAKLDEPEELRAAGSFIDEVVDWFYPADGEEPGYSLPWRSIGDKVKFRPGELSIWQGLTNHGKSQILSHSLVDMVAQGARVCIASLEMNPKVYLSRMVKQAGATGRPTEEYIHTIFELFAEQVWCFNVVGKSKIDRMIEVFDYARRRFGVDVFVIDNLMRMGVNSDDYVGQGDCVFRMTDFATENDVHVHLVAHTRKNKEGRIQAEDIKGASEIGSNAFNILGVYRDKKLEEQIEEAEREMDETTLQDLRGKPGVWFSVNKQRNGDWDGSIGLQYDTDCYQYRGSEDPRHFTYVEAKLPATPEF